MPKSLAIIQSNYIPWKGYFDIIDRVDTFMILDDVQFSKNTWRNRNRLKTPKGPVWLTIPVVTGGKFGQTIAEVEIADRSWAEKHWQQWRQHYAKAPFFDEYGKKLEALYQEAASFGRLSEVNIFFLRALCSWLGIKTEFINSVDHPVEGTKTDRVVNLCRSAGADFYLSGPAAQDYIEVEKFEAAGIALQYIDYSGYPAYPQPYPPFEAAVSVIDLVLSTGPDAMRYIRERSASV